MEIKNNVFFKDGKIKNYATDIYGLSITKIDGYLKNNINEFISKYVMTF